MSDFQVGDKVRVVDPYKGAMYGDLAIIQEIKSDLAEGVQYIVSIARGRYKYVPSFRIAVSSAEILSIQPEDSDENFLKSKSLNSERILTDNPIRNIWLRLSILSTYSGAKDFLKRRYEDIQTTHNDNLIEQKAQGLAFCIRNANEYFNGSLGNSLTSSCLAYYYGTLSLLSALLISRVDNEITLEDVEGYTRKGHGMAVFNDNEVEFPFSVHMSILNNGFLYHYLKNSGIDVSKMHTTRRYDTLKNIDSIDKNKIFSVVDLLSRIPELRNMYIEILQIQPDYVALSINDHEDTNTADFFFPVSQNSKYLTIDKVREIMEWGNDIPLVFDDYYGSYSIVTSKRQPISIVNKYRYELHESIMCYECRVKPLLGINDVLLFDFMFLYSLSIWVRYWPAFWREISEGRHDIFRPLVINFLSSVERVVPNIILDRIYGKRFIFAGHSFLS